MRSAFGQKPEGQSMFLVTVNMPGYHPDHEGEEFECERAARAHINHEAQWHIEQGFRMCDFGLIRRCGVWFLSGRSHCAAGLFFSLFL